MKEEKTEGVVLHTLSYRESSRILSIFTPYKGIISLIVKRVSPKNPLLINLSTPLCHADFIYKVSQSTLYRFIDGHILNLHLSLRRSYAYVNEGGKMLRAISRSQLPGKPSPQLYALLLAYLNHLSSTPHPTTLGTSFLLKLLKHEGLLHLSSTCSRCHAQKSRSFERGESLCSSCASPLAPPFSEEEWTSMLILFHSRQFQAIDPLELSPSLAKTVESVFYDLIG